MSDFDRIEEQRERADGLAYEEWRDRMRADDDEPDDEESIIVAVREDGTYRRENLEEPNDWRERTGRE